MLFLSLYLLVWKVFENMKYINAISESNRKICWSHFKVAINSAVKWLFNPTNFYLFKVTNKNSRKTCEIWRYQSKVTNKNSRKTCEIWRYQSKVVKKDTRTTLITFWFLYYQLRIYFTYFPRVSLVQFQQVNVCRKTASVLNIVPRISSNVFKFLRTFH